jgi:hypothetical protein
MLDLRREGASSEPRWQILARRYFSTSIAMIRPASVGNSNSPFQVVTTSGWALAQRLATPRF